MTVALSGTNRNAAMAVKCSPQIAAVNRAAPTHSAWRIRAPRTTSTESAARIAPVRSERDDQARVPKEMARHPDGCHPGEMHRDAGEAQESAAEERGEAVRRRGRRREADARAGDGDEQREAGERRIVADVVAGVEGQHGDEMGGPDGRARRHCTEEEPPGPGCAAALETLARQRHGGGCAGNADERRNQHELGIVSQQDV